MIVSKLMYGCGALAWYQHECDNLEVIQNGFGRWLWEVGKVRNELVRRGSEWSSFAKKVNLAYLAVFQYKIVPTYEANERAIKPLGLRGILMKWVSMLMSLLHIW